MTYRIGLDRRYKVANYTMAIMAVFLGE